MVQLGIICTHQGFCENKDFWEVAECWYCFIWYTNTVHQDICIICPDASEGTDADVNSQYSQ